MKTFKAHSQRILELMINSIYTNKEIFLRELISNASDALDKARFLSLTDSTVTGEFYIEIAVDKDKRTLTVSDTGIGMDEKELDENLGTIAESGTGKFRQENKTDEQLIGRFGVGFYSAFMAANRIEAITQKHGSLPYRWESDAKGYEITPASKDGRGTAITLHIKQSDDDFDYDTFLDEYYLKSLIKKYSDYIRYPIYIAGEAERKAVNSMVPIWKRSKDTDKNELIEYFKKEYMQFEPPLEIITANMEGDINYRALLFIPAEAPFDYYSPEYERGLSLYSGGVLIMQSCKELLPEHLGFVRGVVDCEDLSLNISREMLQKDRQLSAIASSIEKKLLSSLASMLKKEREKYEKLFTAFGPGLKLGVYNNFGAKKDELKDLLLFRSSKEKTMVTFSEYSSRLNPDDQDKHIFYACGTSYEQIENLPVIDTFKEKGAEVLYLTDRIDEFVMKIMDSYNGIPIRSVLDKDITLGEKTEKTDEHEELLKKIKDILGDKVSAVTLSQKLSGHPVLLTSSNNISLEMEKVLSGVNKDNKVKAQRVLELNPSHAVFKALKTAPEPKLKDAVIILYNQALILSGMPLDDAAEFCGAINRTLE